MNTWYLSNKDRIELLADKPLVLGTDDNSTCTLDRDAIPPEHSIVMYRLDRHGVILMASDRNISISINGHRVGAVGFYHVTSTALVRVRLGNRQFSFVIVFDNSVGEVSEGATCDICAMVLQEKGKAHCRRNLCVNCIETFGSKCPDCGKSLDPTDEQAIGNDIHEFLVEQD